MKRIALCILLMIMTGCATLSSATQATPNLSPLVDTTATQTSLPLAATAAVAIPTVSPLPSQNAEDTLLALLQSNHDCLLPCWFGLTPAKTDNQSAKLLLERLSAISLRTSFKENVGGAHWRVDSDGLLVDTIISFTYNRKLSGYLEDLQVTIEVKKELEAGGYETVWENPLNDRLLQAYRLPRILLTYGQPEGVYVFANEGWGYFELTLDYSDRGFVIRYSAQLEILGDNYVGCISNSFTTLYLWAPEFSYTWAEGVTGTGDEYEIDTLNRDFRPLADVTSTNLNEFYATFSNLDTADCIETPKIMWPGP